MASAVSRDEESNSARDHRLRRRRKEQFSPVEPTAADDVADSLEEKEKYRSLLRHRGPRAQATLDRLQSVLDNTTFESALWRHATVAIQRLSWRTGLFPALYELRGVEKLDREALACGTFGEVYRGQYQESQVCIKMLRLTQRDRKKVMKFYAREAILWGQLSHRNILPFYGLCTIESRPCMISPWAENGNVVEYLQMHPDTNRLALIKDMTNGLAYLHARNIVHGDLKGSNVLVDLLGRACLADFGLSSVYDRRVLDWTSQSAAASSGGSIRWQAPELLQDDARNTKASDIYAWGCTAHEILSGELPYADISNSYLVSVKKMQGVLPSQSSRKIQSWDTAGLETELWAMLNKCWHFEPEKRPNTDFIQSFVGVVSRCVRLRPSAVIYDRDIGTKPNTWTASFFFSPRG